MHHFLHHLAEGGSAGFVMATGELSNSETTRFAVRKALIEHDYVDCVVTLGDDLREATERYARGGGRGNPAPNIEDTARPLFFQCLKEVRELLPQGKDYGGWQRMSDIEVEDLYTFVYGTLADDDELRNHFLQAELRLINAFLLVKHLDDCRQFAD